jgi:nucleoside-diphosphate-sugar epimerase
MARPRAHASTGRQASPPDTSPTRYIARVSFRSGKEIDGDIHPLELLVHAHRDNHPVEVAAQFVAGRLIRITGNEERVRKALRGANALGTQLAATLGALTGSDGIERRAKRLIGVVDRYSYFRFREPTHLSETQVRARIERLQRDARARLRQRGRSPRLHVLLTGATGFLGKELLCQAANDRRIERLVAIVRPETVRDAKTKKVLAVLQPHQRGALLLKRLHISGRRARKFRFIGGDIELPNLGIDADELARLGRSLTHVIHCAASVSFDDSYENSYRANVLGCRNALTFSLGVQQTQGSAFVQHVAIETSYIHGRRKASMAAEDTLDFPRHFYNNFYELTKAMASIETDRFMIEKGLRVAQLLPSIVIGHSRTGNNRGDTKVVNAPINAFGRAKKAVDAAGDGLVAHGRARLVAALATGFPGDPSAELNLVPVDRVVAGILAALTVPEAIGTRIHLATDNRIRSEDMVRITREELGVNVRLSDPIFYRNITLPLVKAVLHRIGEPRLAGALEKLGTIFGGYSEWGQPVHKVGNDVRILGLAIRRPSTEHAFRMLCRHNRYVQEYGRVRDADEIARRERVWEKTIDAIQLESGHEGGAIRPDDFRALLAAHVELTSFRLRARSRGERAPAAPERRHA